MSKEKESNEDQKESGDAKEAPPQEEITQENVEGLNRVLDKVFGKRKDEEE